jgi:CRISPR-associated protein Cmr2
MNQVFWQAKIWGLLHDPALKAFHNNTGRGRNSFWRDLAVMSDWVQNDWDPENRSGKAFQQIHLADYLASASDRGAIGAISQSLNYSEQGLEVYHLLSAEKLNLQLKPDVHQRLLEQKRGEFLNGLEETLLPEFIRTATDAKQVFWWLWRCLPEASCKALANDPQVLLAPAETRLPDSSIWSHTSLTAALAGALAGYDLTTAELQQWPNKQDVSHAYLAAFSFTPVQELIKASRKIRDFWAGSWLLHYLSAKVSWALAFKYGPDSLLYPSLFQQPLIDHWLRDQWPEFEPWVKKPNDRQLLTAGFPNVIIMILPKAKVQAAMRLAEQTLKEEWLAIGHLSFEELTRKDRAWMPGLTEDHKTWKGWLSQQWQSYWSAVAIGKEGEALKNAALEEGRQDEFTPWVDRQNQAYNLRDEPEKPDANPEERQASKLFQDAELKFLQQACARRLERQGRKFSVNVGSWWPNVFAATRRGLAGVKNARTWSLPTAFSVRSTVSGLGPAVHSSQTDWIPEGDVKKLWQRHARLFDGSEQLNATEAVKRVLHKTLPKLLQDKIRPQAVNYPDLSVNYPDLTAGVAGYLKTEGKAAIHHFQLACQEMQDQLNALGLNDVLEDVKDTRWGIPWADDRDHKSWSQSTHSRYLNVGWLLQDFDEAENLMDDSRSQLQQVLDRHYPGNKPGDWYVLAAGDGDGLSEWLKGTKLKPYRDYIPKALHPQCDAQGKFKDKFDESLDEFLNLPKRMGPSTHAALSRALLDFSNKLVPYLTEQRYAGRLIYSGGDDVLAYTNLWEWDQWLWDIRQCFRGDQDPAQEFDNQGDYWRWKGEVTRSDLPARPLFTMGQKATISFGIVIAHHSVPLAIALEQLWDAETGAKAYRSPTQEPKFPKKNAVQVRVLYGNGNILTSTSPFPVFAHWQNLMAALSTGHDTNTLENLPSLFESAATLWQQHPAPQSAIKVWVKAFSDRRDCFADTTLGRQAKSVFEDQLTAFLENLAQSFDLKTFDQEVGNWLKLAAFTLRKRHIKI